MDWFGDLFGNKRKQKEFESQLGALKLRQDRIDKEWAEVKRMITQQKVEKEGPSILQPDETGEVWLQKKPKEDILARHGGKLSKTGQVVPLDEDD